MMMMMMVDRRRAGDKPGKDARLGDHLQHAGFARTLIANDHDLSSGENESDQRRCRRIVTLGRWS